MLTVMAAQQTEIDELRNQVATLHTKASFDLAGTATAAIEGLASHIARLKGGANVDFTFGAISRGTKSKDEE
jgi:hypothetical protein